MHIVNLHHWKQIEIEIHAHTHTLTLTPGEEEERFQKRKKPGKILAITCAAKHKIHKIEILFRLRFDALGCLCVLFLLLLLLLSFNDQCIWTIAEAATFFKSYTFLFLLPLFFFFLYFLCVLFFCCCYSVDSVFLTVLVHHVGVVGVCIHTILVFI